MVFNTGVVDIKAYIESGVLESVILGHASEQEVQEVRCLSHIYPEIQQEFDRIRVSYEAMAMKEAVPAAAHLKTRVLEAIAQEKQMPAETPASQSTGKIVSMTTETSRGNGAWKWAAAASIVLVLGVSALWVLSMSEAKDLRLEMADLKNEQQQNEQVLMAMQVEQERLQSVQEVLTLADVKTVVMNGVSKDPKAEVRVMWSPGDKKAVMVAEKISPAPANMQYQLWAIANGTPKSLGVFTYDELDNMTEPFDVNEQVVDAFAITLEKMGGSPTPTLEMMVVMGALASK